MAIYKSRWKFPPFFTISKFPSFLLTTLLIIIIAPSLNYINYCNAERILFFSHNHITSFEPLALKLAQSGQHQISIVSPMTPENHHPKINHFYPKAAKDLHSKRYSDSEHLILKKIQRENVSSPSFQAQIQVPSSKVEESENLIETCRTFYKSLEFQKWANSHQFDLVIIDSSFKECGMPLAYGKWKAKYILFSRSPDLYSSAEDTEKAEFSWTDFGLDVEEKETFREEIQRELRSLQLDFWREWSFNPKVDELVKQDLNFGGKDGEVEIPGVSELEKKVALHLTNSKLAMGVSKENSKVPPFSFLVGVGGMHCQETSGKISERGIQKYIEDPKSNGFIFISFGSHLRISALPLEKLTIFFEAIRKFPKTRFLLKWENIKVPKGLPDNLLLSRWFKQQEILGHPKCLGFINQGGFLSYQQAVFHGVPSIIIPFDAENEYVAKTVEKLDIGIHLEIRDLTTSLLTQAIAYLIQNRWKENVQKLSKRVLGQPEAALNSAIWHVEYVLKHDQKHFEDSVIKIQIKWWKRRITHILSIFCVLVLSVLYFLLQILKGLFRLILKGKKDESKNRKTSKKVEKEHDIEKEKVKETQKPKPKLTSKSKADVKKAKAKKKHE